MARKILLADDSVTAQNMGRKILADAGYEVVTVNNGSAALKKIAEHKPDLIVLDVYMPGYSGLEVCQRLKETQETSRVPVLLTVGKLEPFKPEEAKRARADGFIVKPFEASELLSALSKLEDKIVPRGESKPGRFARATAAIEESRYDKSVAVDEDSGWKNRIAFPTKKKEKAPEEDGDDPAIYNAVNKDLRTVVDHKPAEKPHEDKPHEQKVHEETAKAEEARVDLGALAPEGLPKDVTPEEIAALAAAAAQVKIAEGKIAEPDSAAAEASSDARLVESKTEPIAGPAIEKQNPEEPAPTPVSAEAQQEPVVPSPVATFAEQKSEEKIEAVAAAVRESESEVVPSPADVMAALAGLEKDVPNSPDANSGSGTFASSPTNEPEPVTMAVAAATDSSASAARWTAVAVALAPEEAAISLEQEMQKAHAVSAAAEISMAQPVTAIPDVEAQSIPPAPQTAEPAEIPVAETLAVASVPEAVQTPSEPSRAATEVAEIPSPSVEPVPEPAPQPVAAKAEEAPTQEAKAEELVPIKAEPAVAGPVVAEPVAEAATQDVREHKNEERKLEHKDNEEHNNESQLNEDQRQEIAELPVPVASVAAESVVEPAEENQEPVPAVVNEVPAEPVVTAQVSSEEVAAVAPIEPLAGGLSEMAKKEQEIAATTAAAWASWRRIRESGDPKATPAEGSTKEAEESTPQDAAAMAVAAGAEQHPEDVSAADDDPEIASIVDSVLADMRPKIVEEIARKMKKKK